MTAAPGEPALSVVIPVRDEGGSLRELHRQLTAILDRLDVRSEVLFVDDGSTDDSPAVMRELADLDPRVAVLRLRRNFGKATALAAGFQYARGEIILTMDADLQDDPAEMPRFLDALEDADLVSGWKTPRRDPLAKRIPSRVFNAVTSRLSRVALHDFNCGFKAYRRDVVEGLDLYGELHRFIPVLAHAKGFKVVEIPVAHRPRVHGRSKYRSERFLRGAFDLATVLFLSVYRRRPLHLFGVLGLAFLSAGFLADAYLTVLWLLGQRPIGNRPLLALGTLLILLGFQMLVFGLLAEMITAATHRRSDVRQLVREVRRTGAVADAPGKRTEMVGMPRASIGEQKP
jgi:glycosyltransferase involved in cell wall biosynthesis